jgi:uncharacterized protein (TIGR00730 family)
VTATATRRLGRVCVFCASSPGARPEYARAARQVGALLAARGIGLVYGGGKVGLMGVLADAAMAAGGEVIGVIPRPLRDREVAHHGVTELRVVGSMHERKRTMHDLSDGFLTLPGGFGTLEEMFETLTWAQLGMHDKPCALLDVAGYYAPLRAMIDRAVEERLVRPEHRAALLWGDDAAELLQRMERFEGGGAADVKWIDGAET